VLQDWCGVLLPDKGGTGRVRRLTPGLVQDGGGKKVKKVSRAGLTTASRYGILKL